jgi:ATP-binding cassette subfamily F protein 3
LYEVENKAELQGLIKRQAELATLIDEAEMRWLELHEALEALPEISA